MDQPDDGFEHRLSDVELELAYVVAVLNAHADLLRSIGLLAAVLAVDTDEPEGEQPPPEQPPPEQR